MSKKVTSTEAVRRFGDLLAEVRHTGGNVVITKNGNAIAKLEPMEPRESITLREFISEWSRIRQESPDPSFADDLEKVQAADKAGESAWE